MSEATFRAIWVREAADGTYEREIRAEPLSRLPEEELLVRVRFSAINYKDGLSASGNRGVTKRYPHIPGVDAAGTVVESLHPDFSPGDEVIVTGNELGANWPGGWSELIRVPAAWAVHRPPGLSLREAMILGSAGFTAALSADKLLHDGVIPGEGEVLVTGATGGVGSMSVALLHRLGFSVTAVSGKQHMHEFLMNIGARRVISREEAVDSTVKPLLSSRWSGVVDTVGGPMLETAIRQTRLEGAVACCGNIGSAELHTSIYPFILRGIALHGVGSAFTPMNKRLEIWRKLSTDWKPADLERFATDATLEEVSSVWVDRILRGQVTGRVVVQP